MLAVSLQPMIWHPRCVFSLLAMRDAPSLLTRRALGLLVLLLTMFPAYLVSRSNAPQAPRQIQRNAGIADGATEVGSSELLGVAIEAHIREVAIRYRISPLLVAAIVEAESDFNPRAVSRRGARGLMQLMPRTAASVRVEDTFDPYENIEGGVRHLRRLMDRFNGDLPLVLAAYNAGEQAVLLYGGVPPYPETRRYVVRILRRIGRGDLVYRVIGSAGAVLIPLTTSGTGSGFALAVTGPALAAWRERQALERQAIPGLRRVADRPAAPALRSERSDFQGP